MKVNRDSRIKRFLLLSIGSLLLLIISVVGIVYYNNRPVQITFPPTKLPGDNGWHGLVRAGDLIRKIDKADHDATPKADWPTPRLKTFVATRADALTLVRQSIKKECVQPIDFNRGFPKANWFLSGRNIAYAFVGESLYYDALGKPDKALESRLDGMEASALGAHGGVLINALLDIAADSICLRDSERLIDRTSSEALARAASRLEKISREKVTFADTIRNDSKITVRYAILMGKNSRDVTQFVKAKDIVRSYGVSDEASRPNDLAAGILFALINKRKVVREIRDYYEAVAQEQSGPYTGTSSVRNPNNYITSVTGRTLLSGRMAFARNDAMLSLFQTEIALRRYYLDRHRYPTSLSALVPKYLDRQPADAFGLGKTFKYKLTNDGKRFSLYSVGPNMKDDGGRFDGWKKTATSGDIVAGKL